MEKNEIEFVNGIRVLPAGFDLEKAERAIDFFLNASFRMYITFSTLAGRYLMLYETLYSGSTSRWRLCELLGVDPGDRATLKNWCKRRGVAGE
jgi:hypothetical protein